MKAGRILITAAVVFTVGFLGEVRVENGDGEVTHVSLGVSQAEAKIPS